MSAIKTALMKENSIEDKNKLSNIIKKEFLTRSGKALARRIYLAEYTLEG